MRQPCLGRTVSRQGICIIKVYTLDNHAPSFSILDEDGKSRRLVTSGYEQVYSPMAFCMVTGPKRPEGSSGISFRGWPRKSLRRTIFV